MKQITEKQIKELIKGKITRKEYDDIVFIIDEKDSELFEKAKKQSDDIYFMIENLEFYQVEFITKRGF